MSLLLFAKAAFVSNSDWQRNIQYTAYKIEVIVTYTQYLHKTNSLDTYGHPCNNDEYHIYNQGQLSIRS